MDTLLKPENKDQLVKILTYHVVPGKYLSRPGKDDQKGPRQGRVENRGRRHADRDLVDGKVMLTDEKGGMATVTIADVYQSNGVIHVVDSVLLPN